MYGKRRMRTARSNSLCRRFPVAFVNGERRLCLGSGVTVSMFLETKSLPYHEATFLQNFLDLTNIHPKRGNSTIQVPI